MKFNMSQIQINKWMFLKIPNKSIILYNNIVLSLKTRKK